MLPSSNDEISFASPTWYVSVRELDWRIFIPSSKRSADLTRLNRRAMSSSLSGQKTNFPSKMRSIEHHGRWSWRKLNTLKLKLHNNISQQSYTIMLHNKVTQSWSASPYLVVQPTVLRPLSHHWSWHLSVGSVVNGPPRPGSVDKWSVFAIKWSIEENVGWKPISPISRSTRLSTGGVSIWSCFKPLSSRSNSLSRMPGFIVSTA